MPRHAIVIGLVLAACGPKQPVEPAPEWQTEAGAERVRLQLIEALLDGDSPAEALVLIRTARERGDEDLALDLFQARALMMTGMPGEARRLLDAYVARRPRDPRAHKALGLLHADAGRLDEAIAAFERATDLDPDDASAWNNLGFVQLADLRFEDAVASLQQAVALDGTSARYRNNLGFALAGAGRYAEALEAFLSAGPPADAHANMGLALERSGDGVAATIQYEQALAYDPEHEPAQEALARLAAPELDTSDAAFPSADDMSTPSPAQETAP